jgi:autotransporter strand-loop-strand O-heptosyltransferase
MNKPKLYIHGSYIGNTGYNQHTRDFFRELSKQLQLKVRNFTVGKTWEGHNETPHDKEPYINEIDKNILYEQVLWNDKGGRDNHKIYPNLSKEFIHDLNIVLCETNHHLFYDSYKGPKIAYNVWETTKQPEDFFNKLKDFDELWVPSKWQRDVTIAQGYDSDKIKVVPEGVDINTFYPKEETHKLTSDGRFKFFLAGRWDYRKSTKEIIETFLKTFDKDEPVDLIVSIDNPFSGDNLETTENRLKHYRLEDERIKIVHFPDREDYIKLLRSSNVFLSCARSEGWNLPLIEAMACGTPSIYSNCSGQLEFAEGKGIPVNIIGEKSASDSSYNHFNGYDGNYYEPDFNHLSQQMRFSYEFNLQIKEKSLQESEEIRNNFNWEKIGEIGYKTIMEFYDKVNSEEYKNQTPQNEIKVSYLEGPKVEIVGDKDEEYFVEFLDENGKLIHSDNISNNMWTSCSRKYYTRWKIRINGVIFDEFDLNNKRVLISMESKSIGDTIAWAPYVIEFAKKHNCKIIFSSFHNSFFSGLEQYKNVEFIEPGQFTNCDTIYRLGWFRGEDNKWDKFEMYPNTLNLIPLQQTATDILGLEYKELNNGLNYTPSLNQETKKYVVFAPNATSGCKEWTYNNWVSLSKLIKDLGYEVITLTQNPYYIDGVKNIWGETWNNVMNYLYYAEAFIGLGSGLSWLNWALGKHTYMINGFAKEGHEFTSNVTRIFNSNVCIFCWNDEVFTFDAGDWDWCPVYQGTSKQHICQKSITPLQVFNELKL